jgi:hypothetical protein
VPAAPKPTRKPIYGVDFDPQNVELMELEDSDDETQLPPLRTQQWFDMLKFISFLCYQLSLMTFFAYYSTNRFTNIYVKDLFRLFLVARPIVIVTYTTLNTFCNMKAAYFVTWTLRAQKLEQREKKRLALMAKPKPPQRDDIKQEESEDSDIQVALGTTDKKKKRIMNVDEEIQFEHPDIPQQAELLWNFVLLPVLMYSGIGRLVIVSERKKTFQFVTHAQEVFIHTFPLLVLTMQNAGSPEIGYNSMGVAACFFPICSLLLTATEVCVLQCYENCNVNLEMRVKLRSHTRLQDLFRATAMALLVTGMSIIFGIFVFENQGCVSDYFEENSICKPCREFVNPFCAECVDRTACEMCDPGFYAFDQQCIDCKIKDSLCLECD